MQVTREIAEKVRDIVMPHRLGYARRIVAMRQSHCKTNRGFDAHFTGHGNSFTEAQSITPEKQSCG